MHVDLLLKIDAAMSVNPNTIVAIDGNAAAGKTTLAKALGRIYSCDVISMDDFFLPKDLRTKERLEEPGGNIHHERFKEEVLDFLVNKQSFSYKPYCCHKEDFKQSIFVKPSKITIVEGSYALHPALADNYNLKVFMKIDPQKQLERIKARNGEKMAEKFKNEWLPMEKKYHQTFDIKANCDLVI